MKRVLIFFALVATVEAGWFNGQGVRVDGPQSIVFTNPSPSFTLETYITNATAAANSNQTLAAILTNGNNAAGQSATNLLDMQGTGVVAWGVGMSIDNITRTALGASQMGYNISTSTIGGTSYGAQQRIGNAGKATIGSSAYGASQAGYNGGTLIIQNGAKGAEQSVENEGAMLTGGAGSMQRGDVASGAGATNYAVGSLQLFNLSAGQGAMTTAGGDASILLGAGTSSNKNAIVAGDSQTSHGDGSITAGGGFYGNGAGLTNITAAQVGAVATNDARYLRAVTNESDTLATVAARGNSWTGGVTLATTGGNVGIGSAATGGKLDIKVTNAIAAINLKGVSFYDGVDHGGGISLLHFYGQQDIAQIGFVDNSKLASSTIPMIRFDVGVGTPNIDAITPVGANFKNISFCADGGSIVVGSRTLPASSKFHVNGTATVNNLVVSGNTTNTGSITANGGFFGSGAGLTGLLLNDGSYLVSSWTGSTNTLKIVSPTGAYTNTITTTP